MITHGDFETRSTVDLKKTTVDVYARHPSTSPWCFAYSFDDNEPDLWTPDTRPASFVDFIKHIKSGGTFYGHNVAFEWHIWNYVLVPRFGWPELKIEQCRCTMAMAYAMALPGSLDGCLQALHAPIEKDMEGNKLMRKMAKPRKLTDGIEGLIWWDEPENIKRIGEYCKQDVRAEQWLHKNLRPLSEREQQVWVLDQKINQRGVYVDRDTITTVMRGVATYKAKLNKRVAEITGGAVKTCTQAEKLTEWLNGRGVKTVGITKAEVLEMLKRPDLPADCKAALTLRQEAGKTSTAKLVKMLDCASADGRLRGMLQYHGASTGRWAGRKAQLQNLPQPKINGKPIKYKDLEPGLSALDDFDWLEMLYDRPLDYVSSALRAMLTAAPGNVLLCGDFASIESRGLAWLAGEDTKLEIFNTHGKVYEHNASVTYNMPLESIGKDSVERQVGKVEELAFGYGGGIGAGSQMAKTYNVDLEACYPALVASVDPEVLDRAHYGLAMFRKRSPDSDMTDEAALATEIMKLGWRAAAPRTVAYWKMLEEAALNAVINPGKTYRAGRIAYKVNGSFLCCRLPSGRIIYYPFPRLKEVETPFTRADGSKVYKTTLFYKGQNSEGHWVTQHIYGGKHAENVTQALCRDLLADAMLRHEAAGYPVVLHTHDEDAAEISVEDCEIHNLNDFLRLMEVTEPWARGLPVKAEGWQGGRYRK